MSFWEFLTDDWKKIPQNLRYFFLVGIFLILLPWIIDHWGTGKTYKFWSWDFRDLSFNLGVTLILVGFLIILLKQIWLLGAIQRYRRKYPLKELGTKFYLIWFSGKLILFDRSSGEYHHVHPYETAQDLLFTTAGIVTNNHFENSEEVEVEKGHKINLKGFKNGGMINTRS